jgi:ADP-heptose:LPS heptosyltransferase
LFRNFLEIVRNSEKFKNHHITFLANALYQDLVNVYDQPYVDKCIWLDRKKFAESRVYRWKFLLNLKKQKYDTLINSTFSRNYYYDDEIAKHARAQYKIACQGDTSNVQGDKSGEVIYSHCIANSTEVFEFYRNRHFFSEVLGQHLNIESPFIASSIVDNNPPYVVIFPGASAGHKRWNAVNFAKLCDHMYGLYPNLNIKIAGSSADKSIAQEIQTHSKHLNLQDCTGSTSLPQLVDLLAGAQLVVTNDTSAVHIAYAVQTKVICLYKGDHLGRFQPYPSNIAKQRMVTVFTPYLQEVNFADIIPEASSVESSQDINQITVETVWQQVQKDLSKA